MMSLWNAKPHMGQSTLLSRLEVYEGKWDVDGGEQEESCDDCNVEE